MSRHFFVALTQWGYLSMTRFLQPKATMQFCEHFLRIVFSPFPMKRVTCRWRNLGHTYRYAFLYKFMPQDSLSMLRFVICSKFYGSESLLFAPPVFGHMYK